MMPTLALLIPQEGRNAPFEISKGPYLRRARWVVLQTVTVHEIHHATAWYFRPTQGER
jgi:hypothetical protein